MKQKTLLLCILLFGVSLASFAGTVIRTRDGKVFRVPVESADIASIEFSPQAAPPKVVRPTTPTPPPAPTTTQVHKTPFDGAWHTHREHTDGCGFKANQDMNFSTDGNGVTSTSNSSVFANARGKLTGNRLSIGYGIVNNVAKAHAELVMSADGKSFSGSFSDNDGHRGTISGSR